MTAPSAFDEVVVVERDGARRKYSTEAFLSLPLTQRVRHILARDLEFFLNGAPVEQRAALLSLRSAEESMRR